MCPDTRERGLESRRICRDAFFFLSQLVNQEHEISDDFEMVKVLN